MELTEQDKQCLASLEHSLWRPETRFDREWIEGVLAPDFFEFGRSGRVYSREDTLAMASRSIDARLDGLDVRLLGPDVAQVTYTTVEDYAGEEQVANRSSLWSRTEDGWELLFHQATAVLR